MARLDKTRARVLCDDYGLCGTQLAQVKQLRQGRTLELAWGWQRDEARVWRYSAKRAARTPPERISGAPHAESVTFAPMLGYPLPQWIACPSPRCRERAPQALDPEVLDVLPIPEIAGYTKL
jgi:hypothetical protein